MPKVGALSAKAILLATTFCVAAFSGQAFASTEKVLFAFSGGSDGSQPVAGLAPGPDGSFYGSTFYGGTANQGVIFQLTPNSNGWSETVLYNFQGGSKDGANPFGTLVFDAAGNMYGTTESGGKGYGYAHGSGEGTVFELSPSGNGWEEKIVHYFYAPPSSGLIKDEAGNFYGETGGGGTNNNGTVFQMKPTATGWVYRPIYQFVGGNDGSYPWGGVIWDLKGNLYGTTIQGGPAFDGTVFELKLQANGRWTEEQLYAFKDTADGIMPEAALVFDKAGNLYGTASTGGDMACAEGYGCGSVFKLTHAGSVWTKSTLHTFTGDPDGHAPMAAMVFDKAGNLFGTTLNGGDNDSGALFELAAQSGGGWQESIVHSFTNASDGGYPSTPLFFDANGNLWGTARDGGSGTQGVVFEFPGLAAE
jgi:uncharacterized repeat protein (TIGR03803 family)